MSEYAIEIEGLAKTYAAHRGEPAVPVGVVKGWIFEAHVK